MLPARSSLREFQELDSSARDVQSHLQPRRVSTRYCHQALTKEIAGWIVLASCCAGTVFLEYQMLLLCGAAFFVSAAACAVAIISSALYLAPEGDERADGLHIRPRTQPRRFCLRSVGSGGPQRLRTTSRSNLRECEPFTFDEKGAEAEGDQI